MKKFFCCLMLLAVLTAGAGQLSLPSGYRPLTEAELVKSGRDATLQKFPDAAAVLVDDLEVTRVEKDGTGVTVDDYCYKILTEEGGRQLRTLSLNFSSVYEKPEVLKAQLLKPDGKIIEIDPKTSSRISIDPSQMNAEIFDPNLRVLTLVFPELQPGDMVRVVFKITAFKVRMPNAWCDITLFQSTHPTLRYTRIVETPETLPLRSTALKNVPDGCVTASCEKKEGLLRYVWRAHDLPQVIPEPAMPSLSSCAARLLVSTNGSWQEISKWYADLCRPRLQAISPALKAKCAELVAGKKSEMEKIRALNGFVANHIRYTGITAEAAAPGFEPHDVSLTFERGHGVCRDKAALLVAMLNEAGIPGRMVLIMAGDPKDAEVPNTYFNHAVVAVERKDRSYLLMDPTSEKSSELFPAYLGNCSYLPARAEGETLLRSPVEPAEKSMVKISTELTLNAGDRMSGQTTIVPTGLLEQIYRSEFYSIPREKMRHFFASLISREIPCIRISDLRVEPENLLDTGKPLKITFRFSADDLLLNHDSVQPIPLPRFAPLFGFVDNFWSRTLLPERKYLLKCTPRAIQETFSLVLPAEVRCEAVPGKFQSEIPGVCRLNGEVSCRRNVISGTTFWSLDAAEILPAEYQKLQTMLRQCSKWWNTPLLVRRELAGAANLNDPLFKDDDFVLLSREKEIELLPENRWQETLKESRYLLKSGGGNLRFSYYEPLEQLEISGFTVGRDGKKLPLSANEIKRMDAPWSAGSTRYPGGKILTASFPGAEPGAKIEYTLQRKVAGRPFFSAVLVSQEKVPALYRKLTLKMAEKNSMRHSPETLGFTLSETKRHGQRIIAAQIGSFLRMPTEPDQPSAADFLPSMRFSNGDYCAYGEMLDAALRRSVARRGQGIRELAAKIQALPPADRLQELQRTAARSFRLIDAPLNKMVLDRFADPESTLKASEVSSADRVIFIAALLEELKIDYRFVAVSEEPFSAKRIKALHAYPEEIFTGILLYLPKENVYLNDTGEYGRVGAARHERKIALELRSGHLKQIVPKRGCETAKKIDCKITFAPAGFRARYNVRCQFYGNAFDAEAERFAARTPALRKLYFQKMANRICRGGEVVKTTVDFNAYPGFWEMSIDVPECGSVFQQYRAVELPLFKALCAETDFASGNRKTPYLNREPVNIRYSCDFNLPTGYRVMRLRSAQNELGHLGYGYYKEEYSTWKRGGSLSGRLEIPVRSFSPGEYRYLEEISYFINQPDNQKIIFVKD